MDTKYFQIPFANGGTRTAVPNPSQGDGSVSYTDGYGVDYALDPGTNPAALLIERAKFNELCFDITSSLARLQQDYAQWISTSDNGGTPYPYNIGAVVRYSDGNLYSSNSNGNTATPGGGGWTLFLSQYALTTALNAEIARAEAAEALLAPRASPTFTGSVTIPNQSPGTNNTLAANTAFVAAAVAAETARAEAAEALLAPLASPNFSGTPEIGGVAIATQTYVTSAVATEASARMAADALLAPLISPAFTGVPTAPTPPGADSSTTIPNTQWVQALLGSFDPAASGYIQLGPWLIQWIVPGSYDPADSTEPSYTLNWAIAFPTACLAWGVSMDLLHSGGSGSAGMDSWYQSFGANTTGIGVQRQNCGTGDWHIPSRAICFGIGH